jgi:hypothetical protein
MIGKEAKITMTSLMPIDLGLLYKVETDPSES